MKNFSIKVDGKEYWISRSLFYFQREKWKIIYSYRDIIGLKKCDFYIEKYNVVIECQGKQHIGYIEGWNTEERYKELLSRNI